MGDKEEMVVPDSEDECLKETVAPSSSVEEIITDKQPISKRSLFRRAASEDNHHHQNIINEDDEGAGDIGKRQKKDAAAAAIIGWPSRKADITLLESLKKSDDKYDMGSLYEDVKPRLDIPNLKEYQVRRRVDKLTNNYLRSRCLNKKEKPNNNYDDNNNNNNNDDDDDDDNNDDDAAMMMNIIDKLSEEIWGEEVGNTREYMSPQQYLDRYPRIHNSMSKLPAYSHHFKESEYDRIIDCMGFLSPKELNEMEKEWADYYKGEGTQELQEDVLMAAKVSDLLEKAKQLSYSYNNHK